MYPRKRKTNIPLCNTKYSWPCTLPPHSQPQNPTRKQAALSKTQLSKRPRDGTSWDTSAIQVNSSQQLHLSNSPDPMNRKCMSLWSSWLITLLMPFFFHCKKKKKNSLLGASKRPSWDLAFFSGSLPFPFLRSHLAVSLLPQPKLSLWRLLCSSANGPFRYISPIL